MIAKTALAAVAIAIALVAPPPAVTMTCDEPVRDGHQLLVYRTCEPELVIVGWPPDAVLKPLGPEIWPAVTPLGSN